MVENSSSTNKLTGRLQEAGEEEDKKTDHCTDELSQENSGKMSELNPAVLRCIYALQQASTTEEKIGALIMVTKVLKAECLDDVAKLRLFDAIGEDFIISLLKETSVPEGCQSSVFKSIALCILTYFVSMKHRRTFFYSIIPELLSIIVDSQYQEDNLTLIYDAFQCMEGIVQRRSGVKAVCQAGGLQCLVDTYILENFSQEYSLKIIRTIMNSEKQNTWIHVLDSFTKLVVHMSKEFSTIHSERKFEICLPLAEVLYSMPESVPVGDGCEWQKMIHHGLCDILLSKVSKEQRAHGLCLGAAALEILGAGWVVEAATKGHQLLLIMVHLACIEVRMSLETNSFEESVDLAPHTVSCYSIIENAIKFLVNESLKLDEKQKQQLYAALKGAFNAVLCFLGELTSEKIQTENRMKQIFVCATIRVLGAWLAEETAANKEEVYNVLPLLVTMAQYNSNYNRSIDKQLHKKYDLETEKLPDLIKFLLPGFCHLTAEDGPRTMLLELGLQNILYEYMMSKVDSLEAAMQRTAAFEGSVERTSNTLVTLCSIFMNIIVTSPDEPRTNPLYVSLLSLVFILNNKIGDDSKYLTLVGNLSVLGLMILRHQHGNVASSNCAVLRFIQGAVRFLWDAHNVEESRDYATLVVSSKYSQIWDELMELWYLGMHNLMLLLESIPWLCDFLIDCDWPQTMVRTLGQVREDGVESAVKTAVEDLLCMIVRCSDLARRELRDADALRIAKMHAMEQLVSVLQSQ